MMSKRTVLLVILGLAVGIQFVPVQRANPPVEGEIQISREVGLIFSRSCYDCHSNETSWPWYSRVAPVSWLVTHDVEEGREHLNFSTWSLYDSAEQLELREEIWEEIEKGKMPRWFYIPLHPDAALTESDKALIERWAHQPGGGQEVFLRE